MHLRCDAVRCDAMRRGALQCNAGASAGDDGGVIRDGVAAGVQARRNALATGAGAGGRNSKPVQGAVSTMETATRVTW